MKTYSLFFSWQSDKPEAKRIISRALKDVQKQLASEGVELTVDQDTRERIGTEDIASTVLKKITDCDVFLGDVSPVSIISRENGDIKRMPNSNVMYEYGYAKGVKGPSRAILVAFMSEDETISQLPFDINHDTITVFRDEKGLQYLALGIKKILKQVDSERDKSPLSYDCKLIFDSLSDEIQIRPKFRRDFNGFSNYEEVLKEKEIPFKAVSYETGHFSGKPFNLKNGLMQPASKEVNKSVVPLSLTFFNNGSEALENSKLRIQSTHQGVQFLDSDTENYMFSNIHSVYDTMTVGETMVFFELKDVNPGDCQILDRFYIYVPFGIDTTTLSWEFSSKRFRKTGELTVNVDRQYKDSYHPEKEPKEAIISEYYIR